MQVCKIWYGAVERARWTFKEGNYQEICLPTLPLGVYFMNTAHYTFFVYT